MRLSNKQLSNYFHFVIEIGRWLKNGNIEIKNGKQSNSNAHYGVFNHRMQKLILIHVKLRINFRITNINININIWVSITKMALKIKHANESEQCE